MQIIRSCIHFPDSTTIRSCQHQNINGVQPVVLNNLMQKLFNFGGKFVLSVVIRSFHFLKKNLLFTSVQVPSTAVEWEMVAAAFEDKWNFPHCIGAMDAKHVAIKAPPRSGSAFYNYKEFFSIVLLAIVDALGRFIWYDIGANGRNNDAGIWRCTELSSF